MSLPNQFGVLWLFTVANNALFFRHFISSRVLQEDSMSLIHY